MRSVSTQGALAVPEVRGKADSKKAKRLNTNLSLTQIDHLNDLVVLFGGLEGDGKNPSRLRSVGPAVGLEGH